MVNKLSSMILSHSELLTTVDKLSHNSQDEKKRQFGSVQKVFSSPHHLVFQVRFPGETRYWYIGRGNQYQGIWEFDKNIPSEFRANDRFCEFFRARLKGAKVFSFEVYSKDRIAILKTGKSKKETHFYFFWRGRDLFFSQQTFESKVSSKIFRSWEGRESLVEFSEKEPPGVEDVFIGLLSKETLPEKKESRSDFGVYFQKVLDGDFFRGMKLSGKKKKSIERKLKNIQKDYDRVSKWGEAQSFLQGLEEGDLEGKYFEFQKIKIKLEKGLGFYKKREFVFNKLKDYKKAESLLAKRLADAKKVLEGLGEEEKELPKIISPIWSIKTNEPSSSKEKKQDAFDIIEIPNIGKMAIGKTAVGNDQIRKEFGSKEDTWFHIEGEVSSHIILKLKSGALLDQNTLVLVGSCLAEYSKYSGQQVPLIYTALKKVKGVKGAPGKVLFKGEKHLTIWIDPEWRGKLSSY